MAQPENLVGQRPGAGLGVAQYPHLPVAPKGLAGQLLRGLPDALRPLLLLVEARVQPDVLLVPPDHLLVEPAEFRAKRPDGLLLVRGRLQDGAPPGRSGPRPGSRPLGPSMPPGPCAAGRSPCAAPRPYRRPTRCRLQKGASPGAPLPPCKDGTSLAVRRASFVSSTASLSLRRQALNRGLPRTAIAAGRPLPPSAALPRALRPRPPAPVPAHTVTASRAARAPAPDTGDNRTPPLPSTSVRLVPKSSSQNHHAHDDSAWQIALPAERQHLVGPRLNVGDALDGTHSTA